ncbi:hypothetical protein [Streptomyces sp. MMG1533]|uniref:hypothetical protein n=1 Tax=Streptomyces sp. MMG1533 TaxID=1415546 RepID=UPI000A8979E8|nr:hypothetical protein [Streptomyces sp. MMG1533]
MPHTTTAATKESRTRRPAHTTPGPARRTPTTSTNVTPLWQGLVTLFAPAKGSEQL